MDKSRGDDAIDEGVRDAARELIQARTNLKEFLLFPGNGMSADAQVVARKESLRAQVESAGVNVRIALELAERRHRRAAEQEQQRIANEEQTERRASEERVAKLAEENTKIAASMQDLTQKNVNLTWVIAIAAIVQALAALGSSYRTGPTSPASIESSKGSSAPVRDSDPIERVDVEDDPADVALRHYPEDGDIHVSSAEGAVDAHEEFLDAANRANGTGKSGHH